MKIARDLRIDGVVYISTTGAEAIGYAASGEPVIFESGKKYVHVLGAEDEGLTYEGAWALKDGRWVKVEEEP